ncbi:serine/arginine-rich splicing factor 5-like [Aethina tumida]|uniref:serine/arginine-rich splicing factor 5-like n=1 Tax=Aethina tumida TaxID=116153 RepID=UPI002149350B|nr:serine/arginine-rich splicing factor 5-like [Aethina tumida]
MSGNRLYLGKLPYDTTKRDLERFFKGYGRIEDILLKNGYGFIEFESSRDAEDAVYDLDGKKLLGQRISVEKARGKPKGGDRSVGVSGGRGIRGRGRKPIRTNYRLLVDNLSSRISWQDLKDHMREAGEVTYADAHRPYVNEAEVEFATYEDMKRAIKMFDGYKLNGRKIELREDPETRRKRSPSDRRSYSRSVSRSRSRSHGSRRNGYRSRSRSYQKSKNGGRNGRRTPSYSRSRTQSAERDGYARSRSVSSQKKRDNSRSRSRSVQKNGKSRSRSVSLQKKRDNSRSRSRSVQKNGKSRSRSVSLQKKRDNSRSRSRSVQKNGKLRSRSSSLQKKTDRTAPRSRSSSIKDETARSRSRSRSDLRSEDKGDISTSDRRNSRSRSRSVEKKSQGERRSVSPNITNEQDDSIACKRSRSRSGSSRESLKRSASRSPSRSPKRSKIEEDRSRSMSQDKN